MTHEEAKQYIEKDHSQTANGAWCAYPEYPDYLGFVPRLQEPEFEIGEGC